jgi:hypothetical protein
MFKCLLADLTETIFTELLLVPVNWAYSGSVLPSLPINSGITILAGLIASTISTRALTFKRRFFAAGSLVTTSTLFFCTPSLILGLKVTLIVPSPPGGIVLADASAAVQPQPAFTFSIISAAVP